jgi:hypothetical protein
MMMTSRQVIQDWISSEVHLSYGARRDVKYTIFKEGDKVFQEIADVDGTPVHTLELPEGLALEKSSYEVMLRYVLADVVNS